MENSKPDWLKALEAQSWQAELIASGLAIYGAISLGTYIDYIAEWSILQFNDRVLGILYYFFIYLYAAHAILVVSFVAHLGLRILWVGILGLSSVYPQGINLESEVYAQHFMKKLKAEFPDLTEYSILLDKFCSLIFSILCALVIVLISISFWLLVYLSISELLVVFLPQSVVNIIGYAILGLVMVAALILSLLTQGKYKESQFAKKYSYPLARSMSRVMYVFGYKAINYVLQTIRTNVTSKLFFIGYMGIILISMLISAPKIVALVPYYKNDVFVDYRARYSKATNNNYLETLNAYYILDPIIQSRAIEDNYLSLFIPQYKREKKQMEQVCGDYEWDNDLSRSENRKLRDQFRNECADKYYKISINGNKITDADISYFTNYNESGKGFQYFINIDSLPFGKHILRIESKYEVEEEGNYEREIPFFKVN